MTSHYLLFLAQTKAPAAAPAPDLFGMLIPFICLGVIFYFLIIRPQKKKQQDHARLISAIKTGDDIVLVGGIHGRVANVKDTTFVVKIAENTKVEVERGSVERVVASAPAANA